MSQEIDPKDFGALQADVKNLMREIHLLREEMSKVNAAINQGKGGLWVIVMSAGVIGSVITLTIKRMFAG